MSRLTPLRRHVDLYRQLPDVVALGILKRAVCVDNVKRTRNRNGGCRWMAKSKVRVFESNPVFALRECNEDNELNVV